jgi:hypothetical protein
MWDFAPPAVASCAYFVSVMAAGLFASSAAFILSAAGAVILEA